MRRISKLSWRVESESGKFNLMEKGFKKSIAFFVGAAYFFVAGPGPVVLHALDHFVETHLSHHHDDGSEHEAQHHSADHDHDQIFSVKSMLSVLPTLAFRLAAPESSEVSGVMADESLVSIGVNFLQQRLRCADPPYLTAFTLLSSSLSNRAPPLV
jgi:hypothetical protein